MLVLNCCICTKSYNIFFHIYGISISNHFFPFLQSLKKKLNQRGPNFSSSLLSCHRSKCTFPTSYEFRTHVATVISHGYFIMSRFGYTPWRHQFFLLDWFQPTSPYIYEFFIKDDFPTSFVLLARNVIYSTTMSCDCFKH